ncbi:MAG: hypothetical protein U0836_15360 [Pirellulales bacterium]
MAALVIGFLAQDSRAELAVTGGSLSVTYNGFAYADPSNIFPGHADILTPDQPILVFGRQWSGSETVGDGPAYTPHNALDATFRPLPITGGGPPSEGIAYTPNFSANRAELTAQFPVGMHTVTYEVNGNGPVPDSAGRNRQSTDLTFDVVGGDIALDSVLGAVQTNGLTSWWVANDGIIDLPGFGSAWLVWGDLALWYDPTRVADGYSGWVFSQQLLLESNPLSDIEFFDTNNVTITTDEHSFTISGALFQNTGSWNPQDGDWGRFSWMTGIKPGTEIGSFSATFDLVPVPEPSAIALGVMALLSLVGLRGTRTR